MFSIGTKILSAFLVLQFVVAPFFIAERARAQAPDTLAAGLGPCVAQLAGYALANAITFATSILSVPIQNLGIQINTGGTAVSTTAEMIKECLLDGLIITIKEALIAAITDSMLRWINSGFEGGPTFVMDPEAFLTDFADRAAGNFIEGLGLGLLCAPFRIDMQIALALKYYSDRNDDDLQCRLSEVMTNIDNFYAGFENIQTWQQWLYVTTHPASDPVTGFLAADGKLKLRVASSKGSWEREFDFGGGFLGAKRCVGYGPSGIECLKYETVTPGKLVQEQVTRVTGTGLYQLEIADEIDEIIGALFQQLLKQLFAPDGLFGIDKDYDGDGSSYLDDLIEDSVNGNFTALKQALITQITAVINQLAAYLAQITDPVVQAEVIAALDYLRNLLIEVQAATDLNEIYDLQQQFRNPPPPIRYNFPPVSGDPVPPPPDDDPAPAP